MATDYLSALNVGSGLNTTEIITAIVDAERIPKEDIINSKIEEKKIKVSSLGQVQTSLSSLDDSLDLIDGLTGIEVSSSGSSVGISISDSSTTDSFSYEIEISALAKSQTLAFDGFSSEDEVLGAGSLLISYGTWSAGSFTQNSSSSETISISSSNTTLKDVKDAINNADIGVTASIIMTDTNQYTIVLKSDTGLDNAISITATETVAGSGLADLNYTSYDANTEIVSASDASFTLDGLSVTRETNTIEDLIDGITITLENTTSSAVTISAEYSAENALLIVNNLVDQINATGNVLRSLSNRSSDGSNGPLVDDPVISYLKRSIRNLTTDAIYGYGDEAIYMTNFGIQTEKDGMLTIDEEKFRDYFNANPSNFLALVQDKFSSSDSDVSVAVTGNDWDPGVYDLSFDGTDASINSESMTLSNGLYVSSAGSTDGLSLDIDASVTSSSIYMGRSIISSLQIIVGNMLETGSDLKNNISSYNENIEDYENELLSLQDQIDAITENYEQRFSRMNTIMEQVKSTESAITNMMDAWRGMLQD